MRKIIWILCAVLFLSACTGNVLDPTDITDITDATDATDTTDAIDLSDLPDVMVKLTFENAPYVGDFFYKMSWQVSEEDQIDHPALQREVKKIPISYPITTLEQVEQYTNALYKICVSQELLDAELISARVYLFSDDVIVVRFRPGWTHNALVYDGIAVFVLISAEDGHVICFDDSESGK